jgi:5S rRNA maturation endonuclease (ribonuclease M5)
MLGMTAELLDFNQAKRQGETGARFSLDADDIRSRLHADARGFVEWLFSGRAFVHRGGKEARIGNVLGEPGASLSISLNGPDAGLWRDHATEQGGDLIELYRAYMGYASGQNFVLSLKEIAKEYFGDPVEVERTQWQPSALDRIEKKKAQLGTKPRADLLELGAPVATYPYYDTRGNVIGSVVRYEPDGTRENKTFRPYCFKTVEGVTKWVMGAPDLRPLYRLPEIALASTVVLVEGEGCAAALASVGIEATTAMQGANAPIEKTDWSPLHGKTVIIWPDNDEPGKRYAAAAAERLASMGCTVKVVTIPIDKPEKWDAGDCVAAGEDPRQWVDGAAALVDQPKPRIRFLSIDDLENLAPPSFLIEDTITDNGLSVLWGRSGAMKSFVALDMGLCVATATAWHGRETKGGLVIYVAAEGSHGLGRRAVGWCRTRGRNLDHSRFRVVPQALVVTSNDLDALVAGVMALGSKPALIILDTLARTFGNGDENKQADMNAYVTAADRLRELTGAHVMIVHHSGVHEDKRERGSNVLRGAADTVIKVERKNETDLEIINKAPQGKQKDAEEFSTVRLRTVKVSYTQAGVEQTTLVLNENEESAQPEGEGGSEVKLGKNDKLVLKTLTEAQGKPLGFIRLRAMTGLNDGTISRSLKVLTDSQKIEQVSENPKAWTIKYVP